MEEFRSPVVDTLTINLVNKKILSPTDFTFPNTDGGIYVNDAARRVFLKNFEERISLKFTHPAFQEQVSYRRAIQHQIQCYKKTLLEGIPYQPYLRSN